MSVKFKVNGVQYQKDMFGVVHQIDREPYVYDPKYSSTYDTPEYQKKSDLLQALRLAYAIGSHGKPIKSLIDVGYGNGAFMKFAKQNINIVGGLDITGVPVPEGCYKTDKFEPVDVVTFFDALEHIPDLMFVREIPTETIIISLPYCHIEERGIEWFSNDYFHLKKDEHLHHFDKNSLIRFMDNMGWECVGVAKIEDLIRKRDPEWNILTAAFKRKSEIWLPISGWEDKYSVSSFGRIKSLSRRIGLGGGYMSKERILEEQNNSNGYKHVSFPTLNRKKITNTVHRLVANAFHPNTDNKPAVNHKNGVRWHNYATNIEWSSVAENCQHGFDFNGRKVDQSKFRKAIKQIDSHGNVVKVWESKLQAAQVGGYSRAALSASIKERKPVYGFMWENV